MKNKSAGFKGFTLFLLFLFINILIVAFFWNKDFEARYSEKILKNIKILERMHSDFSFERIFEKPTQELFSAVCSRNHEEALNIEKTWKAKNGLPDAACEIVYFENSRPLNLDGCVAEDWRFIMKTFNCGKIRKFRTSPQVRNRMIKLLNGGVGFDRLEARPGQLHKISIAGRRTYAVWFSSEGVQSNKINGMVAFFHEEAVTVKMLAQALIRKRVAFGADFGFVDLFFPENSFVPAGIDQKKIISIVSGLNVKSGNQIIEDNNKRLLIVFKPDGRILCRIISEKTPMPFWAVSLMFFWIPVFLKNIVNSDRTIYFSIENLVLMIFVLSVALPVSAMTVYWRQFFASRLESEKIDAAHQLEAYLVQLDTSYSEIFRTSQKKFVSLVEILNGKPEKLQDFIDESVRLEIDGMFDTCLLINASGDFIRPYSGSGFQVRRLVFYKRHYREKILNEFFRLGWVPFDLEAEYALNEPEGNADLLKFVTLMPSQGQAAYSSLAKFAGKDLVNLYNDSLDGISSSDKAEVSTMVMSSLVENEDENPVAKIRQSLGDYVELGFNANQSKNFVDLIKDANGRAIFCMILFSGQYNFAFRYLEKVFAEKDHWPEHVKYMALTRRVFQLNFPAIDLSHKMQWLLDIMQPPKMVHVEERMINGKNSLVCAYVGQRCLGYVFAASMPLEKIAMKLESLKRKLITAAFIVFIALLFVWIQLRNLMFRPANQIAAGVKALSQKQHSHLIKIDSGDEWQQLAQTFNSALEGIKELEIAHFVQTCILPSGPVSVGQSVFSGRTVPASDIGGDYYDVFAVKDNGLVFLMGDVSGHSISAALVVSMARAAFSAIVDSGVIAPDQVLLQMNNLMTDQLRRAKMMTCFAGHIDPSGLLTVCNAGQTYPYLLTADGKAEPLVLAGYPLGVKKKKHLKTMQIQLLSPCRLVMFSDGVIEALNEDGEQFGYERFEALIKKTGCNVEISEFFDEILGDLRTFTIGVPWNDDVTIAALDYKKN